MCLLVWLVSVTDVYVSVVCDCCAYVTAVSVSVVYVSVVYVTAVGDCCVCDCGM